MLQDGNMLKAMKKREKRFWVALYLLIYISIVISVIVQLSMWGFLEVLFELVESIFLVALAAYLISLLVQRFWGRPTADRTFHVLFLCYSVALLWFFVFHPHRGAWM